MKIANLQPAQAKLFKYQCNKFLGDIMKDKHGHIIVNRDQCIYCPDFRWCAYALYEGKPSDCPKLVKALPLEMPKENK